MSEVETEGEGIVPGGVYRKVQCKQDPVTKFGVMTSLFLQSLAEKGLVQDDGGRVPVHRRRGGGGNAHEWELVARPVPLDLFRSLLALAGLLDDLVEVVREHRARKAKSK